MLDVSSSACLSMFEFSFLIFECLFLNVQVLVYQCSSACFSMVEYFVLNVGVVLLNGPH